MNTTNDDRRGAVAGPVKRPVRPLVERLHAYSADTNLSQRYSDAMQDAAEEIKRLRSLLAAPDNGYTHQCLRCLHPYTPSGANEDCPECGHDGSAA